MRQPCVILTTSASSVLTGQGDVILKKVGESKRIVGEGEKINV